MERKETLQWSSSGAESEGGGVGSSGGGPGVGRTHRVGSDAGVVVTQEKALVLSMLAESKWRREIPVVVVLDSIPCGESAEAFCCRKDRERVDKLERALVGEGKDRIHEADRVKFVGVVGVDGEGGCKLAQRWRVVMYPSGSFAPSEVTGRPRGCWRL